MGASSKNIGSASPSELHLKTQVSFWMPQQGSKGSSAKKKKHGKADIIWFLPRKSPLVLSAVIQTRERCAFKFWHSALTKLCTYTARKVDPTG